MDCQPITEMIQMVENYHGSSRGRRGKRAYEGTWSMVCNDPRIRPVHTGISGGLAWIAMIDGGLDSIFFSD